MIRGYMLDGPLYYLILLGPAMKDMVYVYSVW
jgi:hypothetical protein